jgi:DNA-binding NtrC family response regulator
MQILIIEDDEQVQKIICEMLSLSGHTIVTANNGEDGIAKMADNPDISIVITDLFMPKKEGLETIVEIKKTWPKVGIIAISGGGIIDSQISLRCAELLGAAVALKKPFSSGDLLRAIESKAADNVENKVVFDVPDKE